MEQQQQDAEPVLEPEPAELVIFAGLISDITDRWGTHRITFALRGKESFMVGQRTWSGSGQDLAFALRAIDNVRICPDSAGDKLRAAIHGSSGCPLPVGAICAHPPHLEARRHFEGLAEYFGLL